jgi:hypothetical protein
MSTTSQNFYPQNSIKIPVTTFYEISEQIIKFIKDDPNKNPTINILAAGYALECAYPNFAIEIQIKNINEILEAEKKHSDYWELHKYEFENKKTIYEIISERKLSLFEILTSKIRLSSLFRTLIQKVRLFLHV